ncbi:MAG: tail fiber domain-containing protein [Flavobacteriales bacterium]|nr:tail fiber domain-containing protein [Flavobacteriales bacterium]
MSPLGSILIRLAGPALAIALVAPVCAQAPFSTNYQAVVRDALGEPLASTAVTVRFTVRTGSIGGTIAYRETHALTTNAFGLITAGIGEGSPVVGSYAAVTWSASDQYLQVEVDAGTGYVDLGTTRLNSVPYSLHARTTDKALSLADADNDTKVQVEESPDEDIIRFDVAGTERFRMRAGRLEVANTGGSVFMGNGAGANDDLSNNFNTLIGESSGAALTTGANNTALGYNSLLASTTGSFNTAIGMRAMELGSGGQDNTAVGQASLRSNTGHSNTAVGSAAMVNNSSGYLNLGVGFHALILNTTGAQNTAVGANALEANTTGKYNTGLGCEALANNTNADGNAALGFQALRANTTGASNLAAGFSALGANSTGGNNSALGANAMRFNTTGSQNCALGVSALKENTGGGNNVAVGGRAMEGNASVGQCTAVGAYAMFASNGGSFSTALGYESLYSNAGVDNVALGRSSLRTNSSGIQNTAAGSNALLDNTTGNFNSAVGYGALANNTNGLRNAALGHSTLDANTTGGSNTAVGAFALEDNTTASNNTGLGYSANSNAGNFTNSTGVGYDSEPNASNKVQLGNPTVSVIGGYANWSNLSDGRFKSDVRENVAGLDFVLKLRPVTYHLDMEALAGFQGTPQELRLPEAEALKAAELQVGFVAQEVEQAARSIGFEFHGVDRPQHAGAHYGLRYAEFVPPLVKAIQEQHALIQALQAELEVLKALVGQPHADTR